MYLVTGIQHYNTCTGKKVLIRFQSFSFFFRLFNLNNYYETVSRVYIQV